MTTESRLNAFAVSLAAWGVCALEVALPAAEDRGGRTPEADVRLLEKGICRTNLQMVNQAIQDYRRAHRTLPDRLSDLVPRFLADPEVLNCPGSKRAGATSDTGAGYRREDFTDSRTTYLYEFRTNAIPERIGGGSRRSMREWKQLQMGLLGSEVPIVRCFKMHDRNLNLSFGGKVYESGDEWEDNYAHLVVREDLSFTRLFSRGTPLRVISVPPRPPSVPQSLVDLSDFYNASLTQCWTSEGQGPALTNLEASLQTLNGIRFDVRGVVQLYADAAWLDVHPTNVSGIPVDLRGRRLHFLHGTIHRETQRKQIGNYLVRYENGETRSIPILYGVEVADWRSTPADNATSGASRVAWVGNTAPADPVSKPFVLYQTAWENPLPGLRIQALDFASSPETESGPFLIAVTVEP